MIKIKHHSTFKASSKRYLSGCVQCTLKIHLASDNFDSKPCNLPYYFLPYNSPPDVYILRTSFIKSNGLGLSNPMAHIIPRTPQPPQAETTAPEPKMTPLAQIAPPPLAQPPRSIPLTPTAAQPPAPSIRFRHPLSPDVITAADLFPSLPLMPLLSPPPPPHPPRPILRCTSRPYAVARRSQLRLSYPRR